MSTRPLNAIAHESCMLAGLVEGTDVLHHAADGPEDCPHAKCARNALPVVLDMTIDRAWALNDQIERAALPSRKK